MKLVLAIINSDDAQKVIRSLAKEGFSITKLATTGGFLLSGNVTIITGVDDDKVDKVIEIISNTSKSRRQAMPAVSEAGIGAFYDPAMVEVTVGGATVFVMSIDRFEKV